MKPLEVPTCLRQLFPKKVPAGCLLTGEGASLVEFVAEQWLSRFVGEGESAELTRWTAVDMERESPIFVWRSPSFFVKYRLFLLPDLAETKKAAKDEISEYLANPDPGVILFIPSSRNDAAARSVSGIPGVLSASPTGEQLLAAMAGYAVAVAGRAGKILARDAALFLARWIGPDFTRIREEAGKLISAAGDVKEIGESEIRNLCVAAGGCDPFALADSLLHRRRDEGIRMFREFSRSADQDDFHRLMGAIAWTVRKRGAAVLRPDRADEILSALSAIDREIKGESGLSPEQVIEIRLLKMLA